MLHMKVGDGRVELVSYCEMVEDDSVKFDRKQ